MNASLAHRATPLPAEEAPQLRRWTRQEYEQLAQQGLFNHQRVELIDGVIFQRTPQQYPHTSALEKTLRALRTAFGDQCWVRTQCPLLLDDRDQPEPDLAVVSGGPDNYRNHPTTAHLIAEISDTTLAFDRGEKAMLYARAGIPEYWIVNLKDRQVEVHREPGKDGYAQVTVHGAGDRFSPVGSPNVPIAVKDLLP